MTNSDKLKEFLQTESHSLLESISAMFHRMDKEGIDQEQYTLDDLWRAITDEFEVYRRASNHGRQDR